MVLPNPASPATTIPDTSARRTITGRESSAQPSHQLVREGGAGADRSTRAGAVRRRARSARPRVVVQPPDSHQAGRLLLGPDGPPAPGVGQVAGGPLVVGQPGPGDGGHGGGNALGVGLECG